MKTQEQAIWAEVEKELMDLWMNDAPEGEDHDEVIAEDDIDLNDKRGGGAEISGGDEESA